MKTTFILSLIFTGLLIGCQKNDAKPNSDSSPGYYLNCSIDGVPKTFNYKIYTISAFAYSGVAGGGGPYLSVGGYSDSLKTAHLSFNILMISDTASRVYVDVYPDSISTAYTEFHYIDVPDSFQAGSLVERSATTPIINHLVLNITYTDSVSIKGTFIGDVFLNGASAESKKTITMGNFYVPFLGLQ